MKRCHWCNPNNEIYVKYHDYEWGKLCLEEGYLFEMLLLESFQAGLSWECVLNKRENFRRAFDGFDVKKISEYKSEKIAELFENKGIIRNKRKILAAVNNAIVFIQIQKEFGSFCAYLEFFTEKKIFVEIGLVTSNLSDRISEDLQKRGMKFVGSTIIYSYLQAIGIIVSHERECFLYQEK
ncbi:MAG: DNA-3-methyladenine glycosylase I [Clostridia bacterium]|nr:DNA-3-methyladenine glycosylase I [Clostridia bacterium]